jgi:hypothetical protein
MGWGDSNSGPPPEVVFGSGYAGGLTCGSSAPLVTVRARCNPLPAGCACPTVYRWLRPRSVADASGAPVLRDQGPIGRPGTARPIQAVTLLYAIYGTAFPSRSIRRWTCGSECPLGAVTDRC